MDCLLVFLLSFDTLLAAAALGANGVRLEARARLVIACVGTGCLALSFALAGALAAILPPDGLRAVGCAALLVMALSCLFDDAVSRLRGRLERRCLTFHLKGLCFVLHISAEPADADADRSGTLSPREAALLALPLSLDSLVTGLAIGGGAAERLALLGLSFACGLAAATGGETLGRRLGRAMGSRASLVSGLGLLAAALVKAL